MVRIMGFENLREVNESSITLDEWLCEHYNRDDLDDLSANMDSAMKYIHSKGYYINSFSPRNIEILNDSLSHIRFNSLEIMPDDFAMRKNIVRENIGRASFLQIGMYLNCLNCLNTDFLKSRFNDFAAFLPEDRVPYYRGVIERNASVYLGDYLIEKSRRDLAALEKEIGDSIGEGGPGKNLVKSNSFGQTIEYDSLNSKVNDSIYKLNGVSDAAFVSFLMIPTLVAILGLVFIVVALLSQ